ncbi:MAG: hypothetical protein HXX81_00555 [Campylobacterales bacterium]|nr:hypothetical protein [Campylobacterales bacterium]
MAQVEYQGNKIIFNDIVNENFIIEVRDYLKSLDNAIFDLSNCKDLHTAILQIVVVFKALKSGEFILPDEDFAFKKAILGFDICENDIN